MIHHSGIFLDALTNKQKTFLWKKSHVDNIGFLVPVNWAKDAIWDDERHKVFLSSYADKAKWVSCFFTLLRHRPLTADSLVSLCVVSNEPKLTLSLCCHTWSITSACQSRVAFSWNRSIAQGHHHKPITRSATLHFSQPLLSLLFFLSHLCPTLDATHTQADCVCHFCWGREENVEQPGRELAAFVEIFPVWLLNSPLLIKSLSSAAFNPLSLWEEAGDTGPVQACADGGLRYS